MRDDTKNGKVNLGGPAASAYHSMSSKQAMAGNKPQMYIDAVAEVTNQKGRQKGFTNQSQGETTGGKKIKATRAGESMTPEAIVKSLLEN